MDPNSPPALPESDEWSHIRETVSILCLSVCQIEATLADSHSSIDTLTQSFTELVNHTQAISNQIQHLNQPQELAAFKLDISRTAEAMQNNINASISAFQFHDRICQRLDHVARSLEKLSDVMASRQLMDDPSTWRNIQNAIKNSYSMEAERIMFDCIIQGGSIQNALDIYRRHMAQNKNDKHSTNDEIELF